MSTTRLSASDWTRAALDALTRGGVDAVRVDALARQLEITRGSFYWHFKDRDALLTAALEEWERICTTEVIEMLDVVDRPDDRLRTLFRHAFEVDEFEGLEPAILAQADHPVVAPILRRVTRTRLDFLTGAFQEMGQSAATARRQAVAVYAAYVGWLDLRRAAPDVVPEVGKQGRKTAAALDHLLQQFGLRS
jgi:AcrR family transcriptional regulator